MIQRIQSVYLLAVAILMGITSFTTLANFTSTDTVYAFNACGIYSATNQIVSTLPLFILSLVTVTISLIAIFLYKNRKNQTKITLLNSILLIGFYVAFIAYYFMAKGDLKASFHVNFPLALPLVSLIMNQMALRGIRKDEALIKSLNRIR